MNVEIGTEAAQFPEKEYINGIFLAVQYYCIRKHGVDSCSKIGSLFNSQSGTLGGTLRWAMYSGEEREESAKKFIFFAVKDSIL
jgi:hypothetical protein